MQVKIHSTHERDPIPLAIHHFPVCSTYAFFKIPSPEGTGSDEVVVVNDPCHEEEAVMDGKLVLGINPYREICTLHLAGHMLISKDMVMKLAASEAATFAKDSVAMIKSVLAADAEARKSGKDNVSLAAILKPDSILTDEQESQLVQANLTRVQIEPALEDKTEPAIVKDDDNVVEMVSDSSSDEDIAEIPVVKEKKEPEQIDISDDDSEEEATTTVKGSETMNQGRGWYKQSQKW